MSSNTYNVDKVLLVLYTSLFRVPLHKLLFHVPIVFTPGGEPCPIYCV